MSVHIPVEPDAVAGALRCHLPAIAFGGGCGADVRARLIVIARRPSVATATTAKLWAPGLIQLVTR